MRTLNFLPGDAVSLFLGAVKIPFEVYMLGGMLTHSIAFKVTSGNADRVAAVDHERGIGAVFKTDS